jgi:hypothetical protein
VIDVDAEENHGARKRAAGFGCAFPNDKTRVEKRWKKRVADADNGFPVWHWISMRVKWAMQNDDTTVSQIWQWLQVPCRSDFILDSAVEAESDCPFDKLRAPSKVEGLTLAVTRSRRLNCGI